MAALLYEVARLIARYPAWGGLVPELKSKRYEVGGVYVRLSEPCPKSPIACASMTFVPAELSSRAQR